MPAGRWRDQFLIGIDVCDPFSARDIDRDSDSDIDIIEVKPLLHARAIKSRTRAFCSVANRELQPPKLPGCTANVPSLLGR